MPIVKYKNQSGIIYAYDQTSSYDATKKQSRPVRKYLGRVDPETGEIIKTTEKRGRPPKKAGGQGQETEEVDYRKLYEEKCQEVNSLLKELSKTKEENDRLSSQARELKQVITAVRTQVSSLKNL